MKFLICEQRATMAVGATRLAIEQGGAARLAFAERRHVAGDEIVKRRVIRAELQRDEGGQRLADM